MHDYIDNDARDWFQNANHNTFDYGHFLYLWIAFNQLYNFHCYDMHPNCSLPYQLVADLNPRQVGSLPSTQLLQCGCGRNYAKRNVSEWGRVVCVVRYLPTAICEQIINSNEARYFATRLAYSPSRGGWYAAECGIFDIHKTKLDFPNHNALYTLGYVHAWNEFQAGHIHADVAIQHVVRMLYTIRCNLVHGGKTHSQANNREVVRNAIPLLSQVIDGLISTDKSAFASEI